MRKYVHNVSRMLSNLDFSDIFHTNMVILTRLEAAISLSFVEILTNGQHAISTFTVGNFRFLLIPSCYQISADTFKFQISANT